jgi:primosomal protein N' (replication factor Y)
VPQKQRGLFSEDLAPWEEDDLSQQRVATVVFPEAPPGEFDYQVPERFLEAVEPGRRLRVPLGASNRNLTGYCIRVETKAVGARRLKPVCGVVDARPLLSGAMLRLTQWIAEYYLCPLGTVLEAVVPAGVRTDAGTRVAKLVGMAPDAPAKLAGAKTTEAQDRVLAALRRADVPVAMSDLLRVAGCSAAPVETLLRKGVLATAKERVRAQRPAESAVARQKRFQLNADQQKALEAILASLRSREHRTLLLHGATGSGKTEVYIQAIEEVVSYGRQAIVLVPEISLTPQTLERFRARFDRVAVLHSHLADADRSRHWQEIASGRVQVVVGARSALFAPVPHLGLIVLDEEHESTFKQEIAPRYHARDVAAARARAENVPLVLGSATPSLESWHRAKTGVYDLVEMPRRVLGRPLPAVGTIDLRVDEHSRHSRGAISRQLHAAIADALRGGGQVILLLNRRGFSTHIQCQACGHVVCCPDCEIAMTHHRTREIALCHYCDHQVPAPSSCPKCRFAGIRYSGQGTQRLEAEVRARFSGVPCLRMDSDSMQRPGSHERALTAFREGKVRILLGTQMIAKGLDFPNVTLVGVINADTALHLPDFRAAERTFHLVTQVAGRTGRGARGGRVLVQTFSPDHPAIQAAVRHDYRAFADWELPIRKLLCYPPYAHMVRLVIRGPVEKTTAEFADHVAECLRKAADAIEAGARLLGPAPAPFAKLRGKYRFQLQVQSLDGERLRRAVVQATAGLKPPEEIQWIADVDPLEML